MKWIKVEKSLPKVNYDVLLYLSSHVISTGYLRKRRPNIIWKIHSEEENEQVLYWMSLPIPPCASYCSECKNEYVACGCL